MPTLSGALGSPYVRKVATFCQEKGIAFENDPVIPVNQSLEFMAKSPLGKIPVWEDENGALPDSSCICLYLEKLHPAPPLYPENPAEYGQALFWEEYGDTKFMEVTGPIFFHLVIGPVFLNMPTNHERIKEVEGNQPAVFGVVEKILRGAQPVTGDSLSIADLSLGVGLHSLHIVDRTIDASRWPKLAAYSDWLMTRPSFSSITSQIKSALPA